MATINNIYIDQGTTVSATIQVLDSEGLPVNLDGYSAAAQIKKNYASANAVATFTAVVSDPTNGNILLSLTAAQTANIRYGRYVYDCIVSAGAIRYRASEGIVTVYPQVTS